MPMINSETMWLFFPLFFWLVLCDVPLRDQLYWRSSLPNTRFLRLYGLTISACIRECKLRPGCSSVNYKTLFSRCEINDINAVLGRINHPGSVFAMRTDWEEDLSAFCEPACSNGETCNTITKLCEIKECGPPPTVSDTVVYGNRRSVDSKVLYRCTTDTVTAFTSVCLDTGTWSTVPTCPIGQGCNAEIAADATMIPDKPLYAHSESVTYSCHSGFYHASGNLARTCTVGTWSGSQPVCTGVTCSEVIVTNADKTPDKASYTYNEAVTYSCNPGYQRTNGDSVKRCVNMNTWIGSYPICTAVTCSALTMDDGERSPIKDSYAYNEAVTYTCNAGFTHQSGDLVRTCTAINTWSGDAPVCAASSCSNSAYTHLQSYSLCYRIVTVQTDWHTARSNCQADGADLLMVKDAGFKEYIQDNVLSNTRYWIGAYQTPGDNNDWYWVDGSPLSNTHHIWKTGEPNYNSEECAEVRFANGVLEAHDVNCDRSYKYVCSMAAA